MLEDDLEERNRVFETIEAFSNDPASRRAFTTMRLEVLDQIDPHRALSVRRELLELHPADPVLSVAVEIGLQRSNDRPGFVALMRKASRDPSTNGGMAAYAHAAMGRVDVELGAYREAVDAFEASIQYAPEALSLPARVFLPQLYAALEDDSGYCTALRDLATTLPAGTARAVCFRHLSAHFHEVGATEKAIEACQEALRSYPLDYVALQQLDRWSTERNQSEELIDPLMRAFGAEEDPSVSATVGAVLGRRLIDAGRLELASEVLQRVLAERPDELSALMLCAEADHQLERWERAAQYFQSVADHSEAEDPVRFEALHRAAEVTAVKLDDRESAVAMLNRMKSFPDKTPLALETLAKAQEYIGDFTGAAATLQELVEGEDPSSERRVTGLLRLATIQEQHLDDLAGAMQTLRKVGVSSSLNEPVLPGEAAAASYRAVLEREPTHTESYRALRRTLLSANDEDGAFCVEAVLSGLGFANEDETYFHRQRRALLPVQFASTLKAEHRSLLCPQVATPALKLLEALEPVLHRVFPVDAGGYGVDPRSAPTDESLDTIAREIAGVLGIEPGKVCLISPSFGPTVEPWESHLLLVPHSLAQTSRREQQFVLGGLLGRVAFHGIMGDPNRINPTSPQHLEYIIGATCELIVDGHESSHHGGTIFNDIKRRLGDALDAEKKTEWLPLAEEVVRESLPLNGHQLSQDMASAALRTGILMSQDPAVAMECLRRYRTMFTPSNQADHNDEAPLGGGTAGSMRSMSFAVSAEHARLRSRLGIGLGT